MTAKRLGKILAQEFNRDNWGLVDPDSFGDPPRLSDHHDYAGLLEVLERVAKRITKEERTKYGKQSTTTSRTT